MHVFCRYSLVWDVSRKARKAFEMPETCALDVVDRHPEGMTLSAVGPPDPRHRCALAAGGGVMRVVCWYASELLDYDDEPGLVVSAPPVRRDPSGMLWWWAERRRGRQSKEDHSALGVVVSDQRKRAGCSAGER
jgi:hypothetical protein